MADGKEKTAEEAVITDDPSDPKEDAAVAEGKPEANNGTGGADLAALAKQRAQALLSGTAEPTTTEAQATVKEEAESKDEAKTETAASVSLPVEVESLRDMITEILEGVFREEFFDKVEKAEKSAKAAEEHAKKSEEEACEAKEKAEAAESTAHMRTEEQVVLVSQAYQAQHATELRIIKQNSEEMRQAWTQVAPIVDEARKAVTELRDLRQNVVGPDGKRRSLRDIYLRVLASETAIQSGIKEMRQLAKQVQDARNEIVAALKGEESNPPSTTTTSADTDEDEI